jgi:NTE family protein
MSWFRSEPPRIGLALGGGGARGGIHIGVLKVLEAEGIPVHCVAGTSIGALIGAAYCLEPDAEALERRLMEYLESETFRKARFPFMKEASSKDGDGIFTRISSFVKKEFLLNLALARPYIISKKQFRENLDFFLPDVRVQDARIPFAAVAADLESGEPVVIREGSIRDAVYASCTFPGVVEAVRWQERLLVDGGIVSQVPVGAARELRAERVIGVNVEKCIGESAEDLSGMEIIFRADDILSAELTRVQTQDVDVLIHPGLGNTKWYDFQRMPEYVAIGEWVTQQRITEIRGMLNTRPGDWVRRMREAWRDDRPGRSPRLQ